MTYLELYLKMPKEYQDLVLAGMTEGLTLQKAIEAACSMYQVFGPVKQEPESEVTPCTTP